MKSSLFWIGAILLLVVLVYIWLDKSVVMNERDDVDVFAEYKTLESIEEITELIVRIEKEGETEFDKKKGEEKAFSQVKVLEVYKNGSEEEVKYNDVLKVLEPYERIDRGVLPGEIQINKGDYVELMDENEYIVFLKKYPQGYYSVGPLEKGVYNLGNKKPQSANNLVEKEEYKKIKKEVLEKYKQK